MTESQYTSKFLTLWRKIHPKGIAWKVNDWHTAGILDVILVYPKRRVVWIEFKKQGNTPSPMQRETIRRLTSLEHEVYVMTFLEGGRIEVRDGQNTVLQGEVSPADVIRFLEENA